MKTILLTLLCAITSYCSCFCFAQEKDSIDRYKKFRIGYDFKIGNYTDEYLLVSPAVAMHYVIHPKIWLGVRLGTSHMNTHRKTYEGSLAADNIFLKKETKLVLSSSFRYYFNEKKRFSPMVEARAGSLYGERTARHSFTGGGSFGLAIRFPFGGIIHVGYYNDFMQYQATSYRTDGTGHTVYQISNPAPLRRKSQGGFFNFTIN